MGIKTGTFERATISNEVGSIEELGDVIMSAFGDYKQKILRELWDNLMETTPERTGTLRYNWRFRPGDKVGTFLAVNDGTPKPWPREPDEVIYERNWTYLSIYNNSPYIVKVNNGEGGNENNQNFIQRALAMTDARF